MESQTPEETNELKAGDYVIIQRQGYTKLHKLKDKGTVSLGNFTLDIATVLGHRFEEIFQMQATGGGKKTYKLEKVKQMNTVADLNIRQSGTDNRNITDDCGSQALSKEEICRLKEENKSSNDIVGELVRNSKTFSSKTEYSQEKYLKKKERKYFGYIKIRRPTVRLLAEMFYRQDPSKTLGIRIDDLSQILTYANVQSEGDYLLYDSGTNGLVSAALLNTIGRNTTGTLIHVHPGNECQKSAVLAMGYPKELLDRCINVNLYSVLRSYYQNHTEISEKEVNVEKETVDEENNEGGDKKRRKSAEEESESKRFKSEDGSTQKKPQWQLENEKACEVLKNKVDGLILTVKEHPNSIVKELAGFLKGGRNLVVFSLLREPLQELFNYLKTRCDFISIRVSNNFMREYQVLPERTHPVVNMNSGGYILSAYKLCN